MGAMVVDVNKTQFYKVAAEVLGKPVNEDTEVTLWEAYLIDRELKRRQGEKNEHR